MIDIHCHILPQVDDGSRSLEESVEMARMAVEEGIDTMISTAHYHPEIDCPRGQALTEAAGRLNEELRSKGIELTVLTGNELYVNQELIKSLDRGDFLTLAGSRYVLLEFRPDKLPGNMEDIAYEFRIRGCVPIIAHIERYAEVVKDHSLAGDFIEYGYLIQVNAGSIGRGREGASKLARELIKSRMVHFVATDAHRSDFRTPRLRGAYEETAAIGGQAMADAIFIENPRRLLANQEIEPFETNSLKRGGRKSPMDMIRKLINKR